MIFTVTPKFVPANMNRQSSLLFFFLISTVAFATAAFNDYHSDKIMLSDLKAITLHQGKMTNARRSSPVPQLKCVGGSAQHKFQPRVVQCKNQGSDGFDIQWECKTDMDNSYRFGYVGVTCEGYDYPNDPYVLKGSCGLEYTIEFTEEGLQRERQGGGGGSGYSYSYNYNSKHQSEGGLGGLFVFFGILFAIYVIYKMCLAPTTPPGYQAPPTEPTAPPGPPPYGFRPEFMPGQQGKGPPPPYESCAPGFNSSTSNPSYDSHSSSSSAGPHHRSQGGGFWTGAATGGLLGYLFGSNRHNNYRQGNQWGNSGLNSNSFANFGNSSGFPSSSRSSSPPASSSGTRSASGYGGTTRR